jgi:imidazoleglycerol-phosphate dehydratase
MESAQLGYVIEKQSAEEIVLRRRTRESEVRVAVRRAEEAIQYRFNTGISFFNHMLEQVAWRSGYNLEAEFKPIQSSLGHLICEDAGIVMGRAFLRLVEILTESSGVQGYGDAHGTIDEALAFAMVSFEGRSAAFLDLSAAPGAGSQEVEDIHSWNLRQFFDGFAQGGRATIHIRALSGMDPHHTWEAIFRAFGEALGKTLVINSRRKGSSAGLKGTLD